MSRFHPEQEIVVIHLNGAKPSPLKIGQECIIWFIDCEGWIAVYQDQEHIYTNDHFAPKEEYLQAETMVAELVEETLIPMEV